jgi:hypothetical protein
MGFAALYPSYFLLISRFLSVSERQRQIPGISKVDHKFAELRLFRDGRQISRRSPGEADADDRLRRSRRGASILADKEAAASAYAARRALGIDYSWQSGISASASAPQVRSHF